MEKFNYNGYGITVLSSNKRDRTFRIRTDVGTYKTSPMSKEEFFNTLHYNTARDWYNFLRYDNNYTRI